ncbi:hypothetical protein ANANG_G00129770 [Anguilla anguilla]|uniref:Uncharacterized protein n=1 Tax=Anguilla anguilla TaxID=7936 RepID=A0A9D3MHN9_ANGAN|nr:hypothetical protein ANANG_G00129770 [Anguilla anguilla]
MTPTSTRSRWTGSGKRAPRTPLAGRGGVPLGQALHHDGGLPDEAEHAAALLDTVVGAELRALGAELRRQVAGGDGAACAGAAAAVGERLSGTVERAVERVRDAGAETAARQDAALQRLLEAGRDQAARLHEVEGACLKRRGRDNRK